MTRLVFIALAVGALVAPPNEPCPPPAPEAVVTEHEETLSLAWCELQEIAQAAWTLDDVQTARTAVDLQDRVAAALGRDGALVVRRYIPAYRGGQRLYRSTGAAPRAAC